MANERGGIAVTVNILFQLICGTVQSEHLPWTGELNRTCDSAFSSLSLFKFIIRVPASMFKLLVVDGAAVYDIRISENACVMRNEELHVTFS